MGCQNTNWRVYPNSAQLEQPARYNALNFGIGLQAESRDGDAHRIPRQRDGLQHPSPRCCAPATKWRLPDHMADQRIPACVSPRQLHGELGNTVWSQQDTAGGTATLNLPVVYRRWPSAISCRFRASPWNERPSSRANKGKEWRTTGGEQSGPSRASSCLASPNGTRDLQRGCGPSGRRR